MEYLTL